jgi:membrane protein YdbS with pleckstrin-like domain
VSHADSLLANVVAPLLNLPDGPPEPPPGDAGTAQVFRAADAYLHYRYLGLLIAAVISVGGLAIALAVVYALEQWVAFGLLTALLGVIAIQQLIGFGVARLDWELRYYVVTDRSLRIREGAWTLRELTLTFLNVQNVSVEQGPLERLFGISNVVVRTAGGGGGAEQGQAGVGHRAVLRGIINASEVRELIRRRLEAAKSDAGLGDREDAAAAEGGDLFQELAVLREIRAETQGMARAVAPRIVR